MMTKIYGQIIRCALFACLPYGYTWVIAVSRCVCLLTFTPQTQKVATNVRFQPSFDNPWLDPPNFVNCM